MGAKIELGRDGQALVEVNWALQDCDARLEVTENSAEAEALPLVCSTTTSSGAELTLTVSAYEYVLVDDAHLAKIYDLDVHAVTTGGMSSDCTAHVVLALSH